ncbi:MAG: hypothetical protein ACREIU_09710, partial [Planctomycetota bacterium]
MRFPRFFSRPSARIGAALLAAACLAPLASGQDRVVLRSGEKIEGRVVGEEGENLRIDVGYGEIRVRRASVARIEAADPKGGAAPAWSVETVSTRPAPDRRASPRLAPRRIRGEVPAVPEPVEIGEAPASRPASRPAVHPPAPPDLGGTFDERVEAVLARFFWFLPAGGFRIGFGACLVIGTTLLTLFACRMADLEERNLGKSLLFSISLLAILGLAVHFATFSPAGLALLVVVALGAWFGLVRGILGAGAYRGTVLLACFTFSLLLAVMWVEVLGLAFRPATA